MSDTNRGLPRRVPHFLIALAAWGCGNHSDSGATSNGGAGSGGALAIGGASGSSQTGDAGSSGDFTSAGASGGANGGTSGGANEGGAATSSGGKPNVGKECGGLQLERDVTVAGKATDRVTWNDARCEPRSAALVRVGGGYVRQYTYQFNGKPRVATGTGASGHNGWGYPINHVGDSALFGQDKPGDYRPLFVGAHHIVYEYTFELSPGMEVTQHWLFATGRDNPLLAIHYDMTGMSAGFNADTRTPYGDIAWDGDENAATTEVSGVGWGDRYRFITTTAPLTMDSEWSYTEPNVVPYVLAWTDKTDAEMGIVQTETQTQHDAGGYWFYTNWGKTSKNQTKSDGQIGNMPVTWNWTYQINQYELCIEDPNCLHATTRSHRLAWGANYGAVGGSDASGEYSAYGDDRKLKGYPYQSYSVFMVLGQHTRSPVLSAASDVELTQGVSIAPSVGTLVKTLPSGVGSSPDIATDPPGYDARYATWNLVAGKNQVDFAVTVASGALSAPVLVISEFSKDTPPVVHIDGQLARADIDYFASFDSAHSELWLTFASGWSGTQKIQVE